MTTPNDLLDLFGLDERPAAPARSSAILTTESASPAVPATPHALNLDRWSQRRGQEFFEANEAGLAALTLGDDPACAAADLLSAAYDAAPKLTPACTDAVRRDFVEQLLETPEYHALHGLTQHREFESELAALRFAAKLSELYARREVEPPKSDFERRMQALEAVGAAVDEAAREIDSVIDAGAAYGVGSEGHGARDPKRIAELYKRLRNDPGLRRIVELAGRYRLMAQAKQRVKPVHGYDDMVGPDLGGDVGRLLPSELASLGVPGLDDEVLLRLVHQQARVADRRDLRGVGKGPIIVCIDESGSMEQNDKVYTAKALALAMAWVARHQNRWCALVAYSGDSGERILALPPGHRDDAALTHWLVNFIGCGSSIDVPVREMPAYYQALGAPSGKTDLIFITDALCRIPDDVREKFLAWKTQAECRLITLVIQSPPGDLAALSDEVHCLPSLAVTEDGVGRVLSI